MGLKSYIKSWWDPTPQKTVTETPNQPESYYEDRHEAYWGHQTPILYGSFDGEKTPGELGNIYKLTPSYAALRLRAYEANLTNNDITILTEKFFKWVVGSGLKMQCEPNEKVLQTEGLPPLPKEFREKIEMRFEVFANSTLCDNKGMVNLHQLAMDAFKCAFFGDCLVVMRFKDKTPTLQVIDGEHVKNPEFDDKHNWLKKAEEKGHLVRNGIEMDKDGRHVAYYVHVTNAKDSLGLGEYERIEAFGEKSGRKMAWLFGLKKHRVDNDRYIPVITPILERAAKLDRYTEATVGSNEERAKLVYAVEHNQYSDGESPALGMARVAAGKAKNAAPETDGYALGEKVAAQVQASTSKMSINLPRGAQLKAVYAQNEIQYEAFYKAIFKSMAAGITIPPEVAMQEYNSNYSASRAAIGAWEYIVEVQRKDFALNFYIPFYQFWLHTEILKGNIEAPGYLAHSTNFMVTESYGRCRFIGAKMPHIDPVKEVTAVEKMLNNNLITHEKATEKLNNGDFYENQKKLGEEEKAMGKEKVVKNKGAAPLKKVGNGANEE